MSEISISAIVDGGEAKAGPPLAPALAPLGVNISQIIAEINKQTGGFKGVKVPVKVFVDKGTKAWRIEVGFPATSELIKKELSLEKGRKGGEGEPQVVGDLKMEQAVKVAKAKAAGTLAKDVKKAVAEVLGTCVSAGITVNGKDAREVKKELDAGAFDSLMH
ncbi:50S ribosomal protein L11 [uncultured archaeon]|nr:50S ribosomal protein L11 [uncultured archaeon]